jgi:DNA mismatch endonuclease (patch repair protein)
MDTISKARRRANMAAIRSANTKPEMLVRRFLFRNGLRFRLHARWLPGRPDIVVPSRRVVVLVHGCFWHGCTKCVDGRRKVKSNAKYWADKICRNRKRDHRNKRMLRKTGWVPLTIWECEVGKHERLSALLKAIRTHSPRNDGNIARPGVSTSTCATVRLARKTSKR